MTKDDILDALHDSYRYAAPLVRKTDTGEVLFVLEESITTNKPLVVPDPEEILLDFSKLPKSERPQRFDHSRYRTVRLTGKRTVPVANFYKGEYDDSDPLLVHFLIIDEGPTYAAGRLEKPGYTEINLDKLELAGFYSPIAHDDIAEALTYPVRWIDDYSEYITD